MLRFRIFLLFILGSFISLSSYSQDCEADFSFIIECKNVNFSDASSSDDDIQTWQWSFPGGVPNSFNGENPPAILYNTTGSKTVTLSITTENGCTDQKQAQVIIRDFPNANYQWEVSDCPTELTFEGSVNNNTSYSWDFGFDHNDNINTLSPTITFPGVGNYSVSLTAVFENENSFCEFVYSDSIEIYSETEPDFNIIGNENICSLEPVEFENTTSGGSDNNTYHWDFGDGTEYTGFNPPPHVFKAFGNTTQTFNVTLTVFNPDNNCSSNIVKPITVQQRPDAQLASATSTPVGFDNTIKNCQLASTNPIFNVAVYYNPSVETNNQWYHIVSQPGDIVVWDSHERPTLENPASITYSELDIYDLIFTITSSNGCHDIRYYTIVNIGIPAVGIESDGGTEGCGPVDYTFSLGGTSNHHPTTTYQIDFGNGDVIDIDYPAPEYITHTYDTPSCLVNPDTGMLEVQFTANNLCRSSTATLKDIYVYSEPKPLFELSKENGCVGTPLTFHNKTEESWGPSDDCRNDALIFWDFGDGTTQGPNWYSYPYPDVDHTYSDAGLYSVTLTAENFCNNNQANEFEYEVCIEEDLIAEFELTSDSIGCAPLAIEVNNITEEYSFCGNNTYQWTVIEPNETECSIESINWEFSDGESDSIQPSFLFHSPGEYIIRMQYDSECVSNSIYEKSIIVKGPPVLNEIEDITSGCVPLSVNPGLSYHECYAPLDSETSFNWLFPGGEPDISNSSDPGVIVYDNSGIFTATVTAQNECGISNELTAVVLSNPEIVNNSINATNENPICQGDIPDLISGTISPELSGGDGNYSYSWEISPDADFNNPQVLNNNTPDLEYDAPLMEDTYFRRIVYAGGCESISEPILVEVIPGITNNHIYADQTICAGEIPLPITGDEPQGGSSEGSYTYLWQQNTVPETNWTDIVNSNNPEFQPPALNTSRQYRRIVNSNPPDQCPGISEPVTITVNQLPEITSETQVFVCSGESLNYTPTSSIPGTTYQWYVVNENEDCIAGTTQQQGTGIINPVLTNNCNDVLTVSYFITPIGPGDCQGEEVKLLVEVNPDILVELTPANPNLGYGTWTTIDAFISGGIEPYDITWSGGSIDSGQNTTSIITGALTQNTQYEIEIVDASNCSITGSVILNVSDNQPLLTAEVDPSPICIGGSSTLSAIATGGNGIFTYQWFDQDNNPVEPMGESQVTVSPQETTTYTVNASDGFNPDLTEEVTVIVNPTPEITSPLSWEICSQTPVNYIPESNVPGSSFIWTSINNNSDCIQEFGGDGLGDIETIVINNCLIPQEIIYTVTPSGPEPPIPGCPGVPEDIVVTVNPYAHIIDSPDEQTLVSGSLPNPSVLSFNSDVSDHITFSWSTEGNPNLENNYPFSGEGEITFTEPLNILPEGNETEILEYTIVPVFNGNTLSCPGQEFVYQLIIQNTPSAFPVFGGGVFCDDGNNCMDVTLSESQQGVIYDLLLDGKSIGDQRPGNTDGSSVIWECQTEKGLYSVLALNPATGVETFMDGNVTITPLELPTVFNLYTDAATGDCLPVIPLLNGSETDVLYRLNHQFDGQTNENIQEINGNGGMLNFNEQVMEGIYTITAYIQYPETTCSVDMQGEIVTKPLPKEFPVTPQGIICEETEEICISSSEPGIEYQLWINNSPVGGTLRTGTGEQLCFGTVNTPGTYSIHAQNPVTSCEKFFSENIIIHPNPVIYSVSPVNGCANSEILLSGCQPDINYYLYFDPAGDTKELIQQTGPVTCNGESSISFGNFNQEGNYFVQAVNPATNCSAWMNDSTSIYPLPESFNISPQGNSCPPASIKMNDFEEDVIYRLYRNGEFVAEDDAEDGEINFGIQTIPGTYTVKGISEHANSSLECRTDMQGSLEIFEMPLIYSLLPENPVCSPANLYLNNSEENIEYELWHNLNGLVQTKTGTGGIVNFDPVAQPGTYKVIAKNTSCEMQMQGVREVLPLPADYSITPQGSWCENSDLQVGLNHSDTGVIYRLYLTNTPDSPLDSIEGNGEGFVFNYLINQTGEYRIKATNINSKCSKWMSGSIVVHPEPLRYNLTANGQNPPANTYCPGVDIALEHSDAEVVYTLFLPSGDTMVLEGNGESLYFGNFAQPGNYYVIANNPQTNCSVEMYTEINVKSGPNSYDLIAIDEEVRFCEGDESAINLRLVDSDSDTYYQLYKDDTSQPLNQPLTGTNGPLNWNNVSQHGEGAFFVIATFVHDQQCVSYMNSTITTEKITLPTSFLSGDQTICNGESAIIDLDISGYSDFNMEVIYSANGVIQSPVIFHSDSAEFQVITEPSENTTYEIQSITYIDSPHCSNVEHAGSHGVTVSPLPGVEAGNDEQICLSSTFTTQPSLDLAQNPQWQIISGNGTLQNSSSFNASYTPVISDTTNQVVLELKAWGEGACAPYYSSDTVKLGINSLPVIDTGDTGLICETSSFYTDIEVHYGSEYQWNIVSGNGFLTHDQQINTVYNAAEDDSGTTVTLSVEVIGEGVCQNEYVMDTLQIDVSPVPVASIAESAIICAGNIVQMTGSASFHDPGSYQWSVIPESAGYFTDTNVSDPVLIANEVSEITNAMVVFRVNGALPCQNELASDTTVIEIHPKPVLFTGDTDTVCVNSEYFIENASVEFSDSVLWFIESGKGLISNPHDLNATYTPSEEDGGENVILKLRAFGTAVCENTYIEDSLVLYVQPLPEIHTGQALVTCQTNGIQIPEGQVQVNYSDHYFWQIKDSFGNGLIAQPNSLTPVYNPHFSDAGSTVVLEIKAEGQNKCSNSFVKEEIDIKIGVNPVPWFTIIDNQNDSTRCETAPVYFKELSGFGSEQPHPEQEIQQRIWVFENENGYQETIEVSHGGIIHHVFPQAGEYNVTLHVESFIGEQEVCAAYQDMKIIIHPSPFADFQHHAISTCDTRVQFEDLSNTPFNAIKNWFWTFEPGHYSDLPNPAFEYETYGEKTVRLEIQDQKGCKDIKEKNLYIDPVFDFEISLNPFCFGEEAQFFVDPESIVPQENEIVSYRWIYSHLTDVDFSNVTQHTYHQPGNYTISLEATDRTGCLKVKTIPVRVPEPIIPEFIFTDCDPSVMFQLVANSSHDSIVEWIWDFGDGNTRSFLATHPSTIYHQYNTNGTYTVSLSGVDSMGCEGEYVADSVKTRCVGHVSFFVPNAFAPDHPNPEVSIFKPKGTNIKEYHITIMDLWGNLIWESQALSDDMPSESWDGKQNGREMPQGTYIWNAYVKFWDGTVWKLEGSDGKNSGTVTLIR